jgi:hypothetical protein
VHDAEVHERLNAVAEHVSHAGAPEVELVVNDVRRTTRERTAVDADDGSLAMEQPSDATAQATTDPRDDHGTERRGCVAHRNTLRR